MKSPKRICPFDPRLDRAVKLGRFKPEGWLGEAAHREVVFLRLELDRADAPEISAGAFDVVLDRRAPPRIARETRALVGPLVARVPKAAAIELAVGGGDRSEVGVAAALPVHV